MHQIRRIPHATIGGGKFDENRLPKEIKPQEFRVGITPNAAYEAVKAGHRVIIETNAGTGAGFEDADYIAAGAEIIATAAEVFAAADMIVKVKEPQAGERKMLRESQVLFTYSTLPLIRSRQKTSSHQVPLASPMRQ